MSDDFTGRTVPTPLLCNGDTDAANFTVLLCTQQVKSGLHLFTIPQSVNNDGFSEKRVLSFLADGGAGEFSFAAGEVLG